MKFTSMFFTASNSIFEIFLKGTNKRAKKKQRQGIFFDTEFFPYSRYLKPICWIQIGKKCVISHTYIIERLGITQR